MKKDVPRKDTLVNPFTGRRILKGSRTHELVKRVLSEGKSKKMTFGQMLRMYDQVKDDKHYKGVKESAFCGPAGGDKKGTFPVNNQKRCRAALSYAHYAPNPEGLKKCVLEKAKKHGWKCGTTYTKKEKKKIMRS